MLSLNVSTMTFVLYKIVSVFIDSITRTKIKLFTSSHP